MDASCNSGEILFTVKIVDAIILGRSPFLPKRLKMNKIITALIFCVSLFGNIGVSESADCAALYASAPKDIQETYIPRCKEDVAKAKNGDADAAWGIGALYDREKNMLSQ